MGKMPIMIKRVVFDFDNTLFDAETIKDCFWKIGKLHGLSGEEVQALYRRARESSSQITITMESFLQVMKDYLRKQGKEFLDREVFEVVKKMDEAATLLPGAKKVLEFCQRKNVDRYLLSLGVTDWQEKKVRLSGADRFFDKGKIVYTSDTARGKENALREMFGDGYRGEHTLLLDDKPDETEKLLEAFPELIVFLRREPRDMRYGLSDFQAVADSFPGRVIWSTDLNDSIEVFKKIFV